MLLLHLFLAGLLAPSMFTTAEVYFPTDRMTDDELRAYRDLRVQELKEQPGGELSVGGVALPTALADLGLIDEYELVVHPIVAGRGPTLLAGLR